MSEVQDSWKEVAGKAEALGLKLKLHLEQEQHEENQEQEGTERASGDTKAMIDDLAKKLSDAFDSFGHAAKDPAVHADVKEVGALLKDALVTTFTKVGADVSSRKSGAAGGAQSKGSEHQTGPSASGNGVGDEFDGSDDA